MNTSTSYSRENTLSFNSIVQIVKSVKKMGITTSADGTPFPVRGLVKAASGRGKIHFAGNWECRTVDKMGDGIIDSVDAEMNIDDITQELVNKKFCPKCFDHYGFRRDNFRCLFPYVNVLEEKLQLPTDSVAHMPLGIRALIEDFFDAQDNRGRWSDTMTVAKLVREGETILPEAKEQLEQLRETLEQAIRDADARHAASDGKTLQSVADAVVQVTSFIALTPRQLVEGVLFYYTSVIENAEALIAELSSSDAPLLLETFGNAQAALASAALIEGLETYSVMEQSLYQGNSTPVMFLSGMTALRETAMIEKLEDGTEVVTGIPEATDFVQALKSDGSGIERIAGALSRIWTNNKTAVIDNLDGLDSFDGTIPEFLDYKFEQIVEETAVLAFDRTVAALVNELDRGIHPVLVVERPTTGCQECARAYDFTVFNRNTTVTSDSNIYEVPSIVAVWSASHCEEHTMVLDEDVEADDSWVNMATTFLTDGMSAPEAKAAAMAVANM